MIALLPEATLAVDGDYASPYASQWTRQGSVAALSNEALAGAALLLVNLPAALRAAIRARRATSAG